MCGQKSRKKTIIWVISIILLFPAYRIADWLWYYHDRDAIDEVYRQFEQTIRQGDVSTASTLLCPASRTHYPPSSLAVLFNFMQHEDYHLHPQRVIQFTSKTAWLYPKDYTQISRYGGVFFEFENIERKWCLTGHKAYYQD